MCPKKYSPGDNEVPNGTMTGAIPPSTLDAKVIAKEELKLFAPLLVDEKLLDPLVPNDAVDAPPVELMLAM